MNSQKTRYPQIVHWFDLLQEFDLKVQHRSGTSIAHVDALSRVLVENSSDTIDEVVENRLEVLEAIDEMTYIRSMEYGDPEFLNIIDELRSGQPRRQTKNTYELQDGLSKGCPERGEATTLVPKSMRKKLVLCFHDLGGNFSLDRTVNKLMENYYFPKLRRYVKQHISICPECTLFKARKPRDLHPIQPEL